MELTNADIGFLKQMLRHVEVYCEHIPPSDIPCRQYNAYRLLKRQDIGRLQRKINKWKTDD